MGCRWCVAVRFSYLLSVPVIVIAAAVSIFQVILSPSESLPDIDELAMGFVISFAASYIAVNLFMYLVRRLGTYTLWPFAIFAVTTGMIVLVVLVWGLGGRVKD